jgi:LPPG:FO 2-phospho-L-lactate transferase
LIAVLAGGTGSVKLVKGLAALRTDLEVISNIGDNIWLYSLYICPDIDTIVYGLAGLLDEKRGWGVKDDSFECLAQLKEMGMPSWFGLGDRDLATHLIRTNMLKTGSSLSEVTDFIRRSHGVQASIIPATDDEVTTMINTNKGKMHLQEFWVKNRGEPEVTGIQFKGARKANTSRKSIDAVRRAQLVIVAPANPITSIGPMVALTGLRKELAKSRNKVVAISPLIGERAISGPATKYMMALGLPSSPYGVAKYYRDFVSKFVISTSDHKLAHKIRELDMHVYETNITMKNKADQIRLGQYILNEVTSN